MQWLVNLAWIAALLGSLIFASLKDRELSQSAHAYRIALREISTSPEIQQDGRIAKRIDEFLDISPGNLGDVMAFSAELRQINEQLKTGNLKQRPEPDDRGRADGALDD